MSPKELMYIEDTLGHQAQIKTTCTDSATQLQDAELKSFVTELAQKHGESFGRFYSLLQ